jgi:fatty acid desaturase
MGAQTTDLRRTQFSFSQARSLVGDLQKPNPKIYWTDFLLSIITGHLAFHAMYFLPKWLPSGSAWLLPLMAASFVTCVLLYMRCAMFIHELVHLPRNEFKAFRIAWNGLCGIFFLIPSFLYYPHVDHHRRKHYGTDHDGEYISLSHHGPWMIIGFLAQALIIPLLAFARFLIISPICWLIPGARSYVHKHASTMVVDPFYERTDDSPRLRQMIIIQEVLCFAWCVWFLVRGYVMRGELLDPFWLIAYVVGVSLILLNEIRTLGAHRWTGTGEEMSFEDQLLDSVNYPDRPWITELWGPIGTRYHALHHLFPSLPYHNLGAAHRRLMEGLPKDSPYRFTVAKSLTSEIIALFKRSMASVRNNRASSLTVEASTGSS